MEVFKVYMFHKNRYFSSGVLSCAFFFTFMGSKYVVADEFDKQATFLFFLSSNTRFFPNITEKDVNNIKERTSILDLFSCAIVESKNFKYILGSYEKFNKIIDQLINIINIREVAVTIFEKYLSFSAYNPFDDPSNENTLYDKCKTYDDSVFRNLRIAKDFYYEKYASIYISQQVFSQNIDLKNKIIEISKAKENNLKIFAAQLENLVDTALVALKHRRLFPGESPVFYDHLNLNKNAINILKKICKKFESNGVSYFDYITLKLLTVTKSDSLDIRPLERKNLDKYMSAEEKKELVVDKNSDNAYSRVYCVELLKDNGEKEDILLVFPSCKGNAKIKSLNGTFLCRDLSLKSYKELVTSFIKKELSKTKFGTALLKRVENRDDWRHYKSNGMRDRFISATIPPLEYDPTLTLEFKSLESAKRG